jgi:excinuclease ABC subunit A
LCTFGAGPGTPGDVPAELARYEKHTIELVVDRVRVATSERSRLTEAIGNAARVASGQVRVLFEDGRVLAFSADRACPNHPDVSIPELEPRLFSFNAPQGACPGCRGLGVVEAFEPGRLCDPALPPVDGLHAFNADGKVPFAQFDRDALRRVVALLGVAADAPLRAWSERDKHRLFYGDPDVRFDVEVERSAGVERRTRTWMGLVGLMDHVWMYTRFTAFERFRSSVVCGACGGARLNEVARAVDYRGWTLPELAGLTVGEAASRFGGLVLSPREEQIGGLLLKELQERLAFLVTVGLSYLGLDRSAATLSGGEGQRIRLASQVGSALQGITYVLDEPSIGLHPRDNQRLLGALRRLRDRGNSVLVVEHDRETMEAADYIVELGPGAGRDGGLVTAAGAPPSFVRSDAVSAAWLRGERRVPPRAHRRAPAGWLEVRGARAFNLRGVDARIPLKVLTAITGVSGSGKSTLIFEVLEPAVRARLSGQAAPRCDALEGGVDIEQIVEINQQPIGRTPRSNPATYTGAFDRIRTLFAETPEARARGYKPGRFSFNVAGGRCEACEGAGVRVIDMQFLPSVEVPCEVCEGRRFNTETLEIRWKGLSIDQVLALPIRDALVMFAAIPALRRVLGTLDEVGLGYVALGQPSTTLSGGEAQRVKLATELHRAASGHTLYLLDEPTTGLHAEDVTKLVAALHALVDAGHTVVVVEHDLDVVHTADFVVDLGPEGGAGGGQIVGVGTPEQIAAMPSPTGRALAAFVAPAGLMAADAAAPPARASRRPKVLEVRGARLHNLRGVDIDVPHGSMTVITGPSGSGKTSLAMDTVFAEGQRQYVESLSTYARRFLGRMERPPVDRMDGLAPAIAIDQRNATHNPRSTVATVTEIHDVLRLVWARVGTLHCPTCDRVVRAWSPSEAASDLSRVDGSGWLCAALPPEADPEAARRRLVNDGFTRLLVDGVEVRTETAACAPALAAGAWLVVDRLTPARATTNRLEESLARGFALGGGRVWYVPREGGERRMWSTRVECPDHGLVHAEPPTPRHFSFNGRLGACPACEGLGVVRALQVDRVFARPDLGGVEALDPVIATALGRSARKVALYTSALRALGLTAKAPVSSWTEAQRRAILSGVAQPVDVTWKRAWEGSDRQFEEKQSWPGLIAFFAEWQINADHLVTVEGCGSCHGARLRPELRAVKVGGRAIHELLAMPVDRAAAEVAGWSFTGGAATVAERPRAELARRLKFLIDVGLGYLGLDRRAETLSGGESQRIRLASQLGLGLTGVIYVLDEPTIGLHPRDTDRLLRTLTGLRDLGNTLLVVEHDPETIRRADRVLDMGPGAGAEGGQLLAAGTAAEIQANPASLTGGWLAGRYAMPPRRAPRQPRALIHVEGARANNLVGDAVTIGLGTWTTVTGVSGSGKSTLIMDTLVPGLAGQALPAGARVRAEEVVDSVVVVDQRPIGTTPRSTPATVTGVMDGLRALFATTPYARERGWKPGWFSHNADGGRCPVCEGRGSEVIEMHFLPDVWVTCTACRGQRYEDETLSCRYKGRSIADFLSMRCDEALELLGAVPKLRRALQALVDVGLGYVSLGQPANTLSGGEAQRVKLASELYGRKGRAVYVLDEPTTGLHLSDVRRLVEVLHTLVDSGHTVVTIEHHLDMIVQADRVVDLGPEGGAAGGRLVGDGTPDEVACLDTPTGRALRVAL